MACIFFILFWLHVTTTYARIHPVMHQLKTGPVNPDVVEKACAQSSDKDFCISTLKSQGGVNDLKQAALAAIQAASGEASATSELIKAARKREENKEVVEDGIEEETLADCNMSYLILLEILAKGTKALSAGPEITVSGDDVKAALTTAETCEKSIAGGKKSPMVEEIAKKNEIVRKLCGNALSIYKVYATGH